ncbi:MAG: Multiple sugar ABC transporter, ATP-binding protein [Ignavibacteriae bacterium]|nr:MAG: Multiple sugar ABC transporter, ATP-binding protein [Ignavibacteriota bacterium]
MGSVKLENLRKTYEPNNVVVRDINLFIPDKEFIVLVGPSGCGKTTTLRMIAGLEEITEGNIYIDERLINNVPPKDRDIAMVFQNYALYPHMNVFENMAFGLKLRKYSKDEIKKRVEKAADILGIKHLLDRKPKALSGGQRQRVALGRAIVRQPKVFLFDEPLSNLDANLRVQMRTEISRLHHQIETTMIYVTHDQIEAMSMGDRIAVMKDGIIHQVDTPLNIYNNPVNKFVASFIGSPTMNFINGVVEYIENYYFSLTNNEFKIRLPERFKEKLSCYKGKELILGIRPEHIYTIDGKSNYVPIEGYVEVIETVGNEMFIYFNLGDNKLVARIPPDNRVKVKQSFNFFFDTDKLHFFDKSTEKAI